jgi:hypothetical protein
VENGEGVVSVGEQLVRLVRTGGFAGLTMTAAAPVADLPADLQAVLSDAPPSSRARPAAGVDRFSFELTIPIGPKRTRTYRFSEDKVPEGLASVVTHLSSHLAPS